MNSKQESPFAFFRVISPSALLAIGLALLAPLSYYLSLESSLFVPEYLQSIWRQLLEAHAGNSPYQTAALGRPHWSSVFAPRDAPGFHPWFFVLFAPFSLRSLQEFRQLADFIGALSFFGLVLVWILQIGPRLRAPVLSALIGLCAFHYAAFYALYSVPLMLLETLLISCALARFVAGQPRAFCFYLGLASCLSGTALLLLPLAFCMSGSHGRARTYSVAACLLFYFLPALWNAPQFAEYLSSVLQVRAPVGSSYSLYSTWGRYLYLQGLRHEQQLALGWFYLFIALSAASCYLLQRARRHASPEQLAHFAALSFVLLIPWLQPWTLLLCVPALLLACERQPALIALALIAALPAQALLGFQAGRYGAVLCVGVLWVVLACDLARSAACRVGERE
jgi:hypothetical protein